MPKRLRSAPKASIIHALCLGLLSSSRHRSAVAFAPSALTMKRKTCTGTSQALRTSTAKQSDVSNADAFVASGRQLEDGTSSKSVPIPYSKELFSVAPMMGHTNRHYRHYFRLFSRRTHLWTEMIPASQIVRAYRRARGIYLNVGTDRRVRGGIRVEEEFDHEEMMEVIEKMKANPAKEYRLHGAHEREDNLTLHQLIGTSSMTLSSPPSTAVAISPRPTENPVALQLGGKDPATLGTAAAIGAAYGAGEYHEINLNCGCPSNAVGGRSGGCALMAHPELVARCVERMNSGVQSVGRARTTNISVKHRLGARDASTFDAVKDRELNDDEAYEECSGFVRTVSMNGDVDKFHVHARLGLLGEFANDDEEEEEEHKKHKQHKQQQPRESLWVPGGGEGGNKLPTARREKIDHKREQEKALKRARKATVKNRSVPPLRPTVINQLAEEFSQYEFVSNGGIQTLSDVKKIVDTGMFSDEPKTRVVGGMVGRAAINHPCSFAAADSLWDGDRKNAAASGLERRLTRGEVLQYYLKYCDEEEERIRSYCASPAVIETLRRRLVAVPFHLFVGEDGSDEFQRRLKKLREKCRRVKASSVISGAASFVPADTLNKCIDDFMPLSEIARYEGGLKRSSAMQREIY